MPKTLKQVAIDMANAFTRWQLWQGGGSTTLSDLTDVELSDLQADDVLKYDGNKWINAIMQGGGNVSGKVEYITQIGALPIPIQYSNYDIIIFVVPSSDDIQLLGTLICPSSELPKQIQIPITNNSRVVVTNTNMISERPAYCGNVLVYGIKYAPIPEGGNYSRELIYNGYTTNSTITLDKNYSDYDEIKIVFEWQGNSFIPEYTCCDYSLNYVMVFYGNSYAYFNFENNNVIRFNNRSTTQICFYKVYGIKYS